MRSADSRRACAGAVSAMPPHMPMRCPCSSRHHGAMQQMGGGATRRCSCVPSTTARIRCICAHAPGTTTAGPRTVQPLQHLVEVLRAAQHSTAGRAPGRLPPADAICHLCAWRNGGTASSSILHTRGKLIPAAQSAQNLDHTENATGTSIAPRLPCSQHATRSSPLQPALLRQPPALTALTTSSAPLAYATMAKQSAMGSPLRRRRGRGRRASARCKFCTCFVRMSVRQEAGTHKMRTLTQASAHWHAPCASTHTPPSTPPARKLARGQRGIVHRDGAAVRPVSGLVPGQEQVCVCVQGRQAGAEGLCVKGPC